MSSQNTIWRFFRVAKRRPNSQATLSAIVDDLEPRCLMTGGFDIPPPFLIASDDHFGALPDDVVVLDVLANDIGVGLQIISVSGTSGGTVSIGSLGQNLIYQLPPPVATDISISESIPLAETTPSPDRVIEGPTVDLIPFVDTFSYQVQDATGAVASAFVQANDPAAPIWRIPSGQKPKKTGIEGLPGFAIEIEETFGLNPNARAKNPVIVPQQGTQVWQKTSRSGSIIYKDIIGAIRIKDVPAELFLSGKTLEVTDSTPLRVTHTVECTLPADVMAVAVVIENRTLSVGLNSKNQTVTFPAPIPPATTAPPFKASKADVAATNEFNGRFRSAETTSQYIYFNKTVFEALHTLGDVTDEKYAEVTKTLKDAGIDYGKQKSVFERLTIKGVGIWEKQLDAPTPPPAAPSSGDNDSSFYGVTGSDSANSDVGSNAASEGGDENASGTLNVEPPPTASSGINFDSNAVIVLLSNDAYFAALAVDLFAI